MANARSRFCGLFLLAVATAMLSTCGNGLGPLVPVNLQIDSLRFDTFYSRAPEAGILAVYAQLADTAARLGPSERIPVSITVEGGDEETLSLEPKVCFLPGPYSCTLVSIGTKAGRTVDELNAVLPTIPARLWIVGPSRTNAGVRVFDSRKVEDAIRVFRGHSAIASAERDGIGVPGVDPPPHFPSQLLAALPLDYGDPKADDGKVQGQKAALMTIRYTQPDGTVLTRTLALP
jgi:hypothetical protein